MLGKHQVQKHTFGREVKPLRPLENYANYNTVQDPKVDFEYLKTNVTDVPHEMAVEQILLESPSSSSGSQEDKDIVENLKPEEIITKELKVKQYTHNIYHL